MKLADMVEEGRCCRRNISVEYSERSEFSALHVGHWTGVWHMYVNFQAQPRVFRFMSPPRHC